MSSHFLHEIHSLFKLSNLKQFKVLPNQIHIINGPTEFLNTLKTQSLLAQNRVYLSSLYLGNGKQEEEFVSVLDKALQTNPDLKMRWILDGCRGTRGNRSSVSMLSPLLRQYTNNFQLHLFYFPFLFSSMGKIYQKILPQKVLEIFNVYHIKIYLFDNRVILSGANLSKTYFTDRVDRYIMIESPQLCDYYETLLNTISEFSSPVQSDGTIIKRKPQKDFKEQFMKAFLDNSKNSLEEEQEIENSYVYLYPTFQLCPFGIETDKQVLLQLLRRSYQYPFKEIFISSGYLNIPKYLTDCFSSKNKDSPHVSFITSSPKANSFFSDPSYPSHIPLLYSYAEEQLYDRLINQKIPFSMYEYVHKTWSFHAKGLWITNKSNKQTDIIATIGSPNFGSRSMKSDFETQLYMISKDPCFYSMMQNEIQSIFYQDTQKISKETFKEQSRIPPASRIHSKWMLSILASIGKYAL